MLDDLVTAIQTVKARIRDHRDSLSQNEYRTRISLIDPVLNALGWDVSDPALVTHEYAVGNGRADYALLRKDGSPTAFIEAKRLGEMADASRHETQLFTYAVTQGVKYAGLTDGDRWLFDNLTARFSGGDSRLLDMTLSRESAHQCALKLLLLWHPTLAAGQPIEPNIPVFVTPPSPDPIIDPSPPDPDWVSLATYKVEGDGKPPQIRLPDQKEVQLKYWYEILVEVAEWLARTGELSSESCPVTNSQGGGLVNVEPRERHGGPFRSHRQLGNGLFVKTHGSSITILGSTKILLKHFGQDPASILLKPSK